MTGWVRSSACAAGDCIEVRQRPEPDGRIVIAIGSSVIVVGRAEWDAFTAGIKAGDFDNLGSTP